MATSVSDSLRESLEADWAAFLAVLERALLEHRARLLRSYRQSLEPWHRALFAELRSTEARSAFTTAWGEAFAGPLAPEPGRGPGAESVLHQELRTVTDMLLDLVETLPDITPQRPTQQPKRKESWIRKRFRQVIGLKEGIKAGGTLLGTLKDLLESAPGWFRALLTIGEEAADVVTGG